MSAPLPQVPETGVPLAGGEVLSASEIASLVSGLDDLTLEALIRAGRAEQHRRALEGGDLEAVISEAFAAAFDAGGDAHMPFASGTMVVCPGSRINTSASAHRCRFAVVDGDWVWESPALLHDEVRSVRSAKGGTHSVSLVVLREGLEIDVVTSRARSGAHEAQRVDSYTVAGGALVKVGSRRGRSAPSDR